MKHLNIREEQKNKSRSLQGQKGLTKESKDWNRKRAVKVKSTQLDQEEQKLITEKLTVMRKTMMCLM